ncbi:ABC transporter substrate-binding protein [Pseudorhodoplanes sp.]|uniref:ABC transporter substrate-binding protein n=1 Tax=Pseudorhodoplanes sp. TaxID=1934341 RepID=UPI003D09F5D3
MIKRLAALAAMVFVLVGSPAWAQDPIRVGVIAPFTGPFAIIGTNFKAGIEAYQTVHGDGVDGRKVEFLYRDLQNTDVAAARALAQELVSKDRVSYLAGFYFTPDALAVAPLLERAGVPLVIFNAATSVITEKSPLIVRTSFTMAQVTVPMGQIAREQNISKVVIAVSDYAPGLDTELAFKESFEKAGGKIVDTIRIPLRTSDFSPIMQRIKDSGAEAVFAFLPSGPPTLAFAKSFIDNGVKERGIRLLSLGAVTQESDLPSLGDAVLGVQSTWHYSTAHPGAVNKAFLDAIQRKLGTLEEITFPAVGAYDGVHIIYEMIKATKGERKPKEAVEAVKGMSWESPRGPVKIDPETRHIRQNVYLREVAKQDGRYINKEIRTFPDQPDFGLMKSN